MGENQATDPITVASTGIDRKVLLIRQDDIGVRTIPGGMVAPKAMARLYVEDWRNTDHAWICTTCPSRSPQPLATTPPTGSSKPHTTTHSNSPSKRSDDPRIRHGKQLFPRRSGHKKGLGLKAVYPPSTRGPCLLLTDVYGAAWRFARRPSGSNRVG